MKMNDYMGKSQLKWVKWETTRKAHWSVVSGLRNAIPLWDMLFWKVKIETKERLWITGKHFIVLCSPFPRNWNGSMTWLRTHVQAWARVCVSAECFYSQYINTPHIHAYWISFFRRISLFLTGALWSHTRRWKGPWNQVVLGITLNDDPPHRIHGHYVYNLSLLP